MNTYLVTFTGDPGHSSADVSRLTLRATSVREALEQAETARPHTRIIEIRRVTPIPPITEAQVRDLFDTDLGDDPIITSSTFESAQIKYLVLILSDLVPGLTCDISDSEDPVLLVEIHDPVTERYTAIDCDLYDLIGRENLNEYGCPHEEICGRDLDVKIAMCIINLARQLV